MAFQAHLRLSGPSESNQLFRLTGPTRREHNFLAERGKGGLHLYINSLEEFNQRMPDILHGWAVVKGAFPSWSFSILLSGDMEPAANAKDNAALDKERNEITNLVEAIMAKCLFMDLQRLPNAEVRIPVILAALPDFRELCSKPIREPLLAEMTRANRPLIAKAMALIYDEPAATTATAPAPSADAPATEGEATDDEKWDGGGKVVGADEVSEAEALATAAAAQAPATTEDGAFPGLDAQIPWWEFVARFPDVEITAVLPEGKRLATKEEVESGTVETLEAGTWAPDLEFLGKHKTVAVLHLTDAPAPKAAAATTTAPKPASAKPRAATKATTAKRKAKRKPAAK